MSEGIVLTLVGALLATIFALVGVILYLFNRMLKAQEANAGSKTPTTEEGPIEKKQFNPTPTKLKSSVVFEEDPNLTYCVNHVQDHAAGMCAICAECFCEDCIKEHDGMSFCAPHFKMFLNHEWVELDSIKTTPETPETALPLYDFKKEFWAETKTPMIISTHYKINIDDDTIESYVKLLARNEEAEELKGKYQNLLNTLSSKENLEKNEKLEKNFKH